MISPEMRQQVRHNLHREVGGFFTNAIRSSSTCRVCTAPATAGLCAQCASHRSQYGNQLADQVVPLAYAKGNMNHQSGHHMYRYKNRINPSIECQRDLKLMILGATLLHGECIARAHGWWDVITFVSSETRPGTAHPVVELARQVVSRNEPEVIRILLGIGPDIEAEPKRFPLPERFIVADQWRASVAGRHVLIVDDTWVSGNKSQSAALALKAAGARAVTIICLARWLSPTFSVEQDQFVRTAVAPYDALTCPVTGGACPVG